MTKRNDLERRYPDLLRQEDDQALYELVNDLDAAYTRPELPHELTWATTKARAKTILRLQQENTFMLDYPKALRSAGITILLCLLLWQGWLIFEGIYVGTSYERSVTLHFFSIWLSLIIAVGVLIWSFLRGKPHIAYAGLHAFCLIGFYCLVQLYFYDFSLSEGHGAILLAGPPAISLLLCVFIQPILPVLSWLQRLFRIQVVDRLRSSIPKQATEDHLPEDAFLYEGGYKAFQTEAVSADEEWYIPTIQSKIVTEEGEKHFSDYNRNLEQRQSQE